MRFLAFFSLSWFFLSVDSSQIDLSSSPIDLFHDDSQLFATGPQLEEAGSLDQSFGSPDLFSEDYQSLSPVESDPSSVFADTYPNQVAPPDPSFFIAGDTACDSSDAADPQLFGKIRRRGDTCKSPPVGEAVGHSRQPGDSDQLPDLGFTNFATARRTKTVFPTNYDVCPYARFLGANIPVCKEPNPQDISQLPGVTWFNLRDVVPCTICWTYLHFLPPLPTDLVSKCLLITICKSLLQRGRTDVLWFELRARRIVVLSASSISRTRTILSRKISSKSNFTPDERTGQCDPFGRQPH